MVASTRRINLPDAVERIAHKLARSRTANIRIGKVTAVNGDNSVNVALGGGTVIAQTLGATYAVNDIIAMAMDTDAYWVLGTPNVAGAGGGGVTNPLIGNFEIRDAATPTKAYRFRTSGTYLDLEVGASRLYVSVWSGVGFTGSQYTKLILPSDDTPINAVQGIYKGLPETSYARFISPATWTNTTTSFTDVTGIQVTHDKVVNGSKLRIEVGGTWWTQAGTIGIILAVNVNGGDYEIYSQEPAVNSTAHMAFHGVTYVTGVPFGTYTIKLRGKSTSAGTGIQIDSADFAYIDVMETN
jgi:hypothetical protein